jgi:hypothetical protein
MAYVERLPDTVEIKKYDSLNDTSLTLVTTSKALNEMAAKLRAAGEIAVRAQRFHAFSKSNNRLFGLDVYGTS